MVSDWESQHYLIHVNYLVWVKRTFNVVSLFMLDVDLIPVHDLLMLMYYCRVHCSIT